MFFFFLRFFLAFLFLSVSFLSFSFFVFFIVMFFFWERICGLMWSGKTFNFSIFNLQFSNLVSHTKFEN